jgi:uncharacterized protein (DUF924 family)
MACRVAFEKLPCEMNVAAAAEVWQQAFEASLLNVLLDLVRREIAPETYRAFELVALAGVPAADAAQLTGLSRNAVYLARKRVLQRLRELGESYRSDGQLVDRVKQALASSPSAHVERSLTQWMGQSTSWIWLMAFPEHRPQMPRNTYRRHWWGG